MKPSVIIDCFLHICVALTAMLGLVGGIYFGAWLGEHYWPEKDGAKLLGLPVGFGMYGVVACLLCPVMGYLDRRENGERRVDRNMPETSTYGRLQRDINLVDGNDDEVIDVNRRREVLTSSVQAVRLANDNDANLEMPSDDEVGVGDMRLVN